MPSQCNRRGNGDGDGDGGVGRARQCLAEAIGVMALSGATLQRRIAEACAGPLRRLNADDLPEPLRQRWEDLRRELLAYLPIGGGPLLWMSHETAAALIRRLAAVLGALEAQYPDPHGGAQPRRGGKARKRPGGRGDG